MCLISIKTPFFYSTLKHSNLIENGGNQSKIKKSIKIDKINQKKIFVGFNLLIDINIVIFDLLIENWSKSINFNHKLIEIDI